MSIHFAKQTVSPHWQPAPYLLKDDDDDPDNDVTLAPDKADPIEELIVDGGGTGDRKTTSRILLLFTAALYGTNFSCIKLLGLMDLAIPIGMSCTLRFGLAVLSTSAPLVFFMTARQKEQKNQKQGAFLSGLEVGLWNSIGYISQAVGLETTLASKSAFLCSLAVVVVPLLDWIRGKRLQWREIVGVVLALIGVALLEMRDARLLPVTDGDLISMIQPFAFGVGFWRMEAAMQRFPSEANICTVAQLLAVFLASAVYSLVAESGWETVGSYGNSFQDPLLWMGLVWTGVVTTGLCVYMETMALRTLSATEATLLLSTEPLWGSIVAGILIGESFGLCAMVGGTFVVLACVWSNLGVDRLRNFAEQHIRLYRHDAPSVLSLSR